jgi:hypothetical protein
MISLSFYHFDNTTGQEYAGIAEIHISTFNEEFESEQTSYEVEIVQLWDQEGNDLELTRDGGLIAVEGWGWEENQALREAAWDKAAAYQEAEAA